MCTSQLSGLANNAVLISMSNHQISSVCSDPEAGNAYRGTWYDDGAGHKVKRREKISFTVFLCVVFSLSTLLSLSLSLLSLSLSLTPFRSLVFLQVPVSSPTAGTALSSRQSLTLSTLSTSPSSRRS
jgi:hypothetical protein